MATHTGNDVTLVLNVAGVELFRCAIINFSEDDNYTETRLDMLGDCDAEIDQMFESYSGTFTVAEKDSNLRRLREFYAENVRRRGVNLNVVLSVDRVYPDGSNFPYRYEQCRLTFSSSDEKNQPSQTTVNWTTTRPIVSTLGPINIGAFPVAP